MITIEEFRTRFPEFSDEDEYSDARIQIFLDDSTCIMGTAESRWCSPCKYNMAMAFLTAHLLFTGTRTEAGDSSASVGAISSKSAGGVSVTKSVVAKDRTDGDDFYASTAYGLQFLNIRNSCFIGVLTARFC
jgi:hypothetical protein